MYVIGKDADDGNMRIASYPGGGSMLEFDTQEEAEEFIAENPQFAGGHVYDKDDLSFD